ncbi:MAG TPA: DUF2127 domain-containing protein [Acidimicrobiales bacterium]|nr:DUF2127 domain-containing protein [Acidimicrobiales bacterium]
MTAEQPDPEDESSQRLDRAFRISVTLKGLDGVLEVVGGLVLLFVSPASINHLARWAVAHELTGDPHDFISRHLLHSASMLTRSTTLYGAAYLLIHGGAKLVLVVLVLRNKLWAYPWLVALLLAFVVYQTYRLTQKPSFGLIALTLFDLFVAWLTWREYTKKRAVASHEVAGVQGGQ